MPVKAAEIFEETEPSTRRPTKPNLSFQTKLLFLNNI